MEKAIPTKSAILVDFEKELDVLLKAFHKRAVENEEKLFFVGFSYDEKRSAAVASSHMDGLSTMLILSEKLPKDVTKVSIGVIEKIME